LDASSTFLTEFAKGRDAIYFAEHIMGVRLNPAQIRWFNLALRTRNGWQWVFRRGAHVSGNQTGKTLGMALAVLWAANYKIGIENSDWDTWLSSAYNWFHLAPTYTQSLLLRNDMANLMEGKHPAQFDRATGEFRKVLWQPGLAVEKKIDATYYAFEMWNGSKVHFRSSDNKAKSLQGVRAHGVSFDEAAFEDHLTIVMDQAVKLRLISTGGPLIMASTPNGINDYYQIVQDIRSKSVQTGDRTWESEEQQCYLVWSHVSDNIGYGYTQEDVDYLEGDIDPATKEQQLRGAFLNPEDAFFVPIEDIEAAFQAIPAEDAPRNNHNYVAFWDVSVASDPTVCVVIDITKEPFKGVYYRRWEKPMPFRELLSEMRRIHFYYSAPIYKMPGRAPTIITGFDASSMGGVAVKQELADMHPLRPLTMTGSSRVKQELLINLRKSLSTKRLILPKEWVQAMREILSYREKDEKLKQDSVMALTGAVKVAGVGMGGRGIRAPFSTNNRSNYPSAYGRTRR
jgi:hypothetical protein